MRVAGKIPVYVGKIKPETETVKEFYLYPEDHELLPAFTGGSHIVTFIKDGEKTIEKHYSLVGDPTDRSQYVIAIRRNEQSRGGSVYWHDHVKEGDHFEISFPRNHFPLSFMAKHHVFYAAGIGITPFISMMADLQKAGRDFELHYAAKTRKLCAFYDYLNETYPGKCTFYFSQENHPAKMAPEIMLDHRIGTHVYFCGPQAMVSEYKKAAKSYGYPEQSIHFELFAAGVTGPQNAFVVELAKSKKTIEVPANQTLLEALLAAGIKAPYSCKAGGCGSCEVEVVNGRVDHHDSFFSEEERNERHSILTCCSRAKNEKIILNL